jgi:hypothetical protein
VLETEPVECLGIVHCSHQSGRSTVLKVVTDLIPGSDQQVVHRRPLDPSLLVERREEAVKRFAKKSLEGTHSHWFPLNEAARTTRNQKKYGKTYARCDRLISSPIFHMRRVLNKE